MNRSGSGIRNRSGVRSGSRKEASRFVTLGPGENLLVWSTGESRLRDSSRRLATPEPMISSASATTSRRS